MPVNLNPDAIEAAHRHCADDGDIGNLARGLLSAAAQLEGLQKLIGPVPANIPDPNENTYDPDEDEDTSPLPSPRRTPSHPKPKAHVSPPRHRK